MMRFAGFFGSVSLAFAAVCGGALAQDTTPDGDALLASYRDALTERAVLRNFNETRTQQIEDQQVFIAQLEADIVTVQERQREMLPLLEKLVDELASFIEADLPFRSSERAAGVDRLRRQISAITELEPGDQVGPLAETYRLVQEAYQIEAEYGRAMGAYDGKITNEAGEDIDVDYLHVGRVALFRIAADDSFLEVFNPDASAYEPLGGRYIPEVRKAVRIVKAQTPPDLVDIPVKAPIRQ